MKSPESKITILKVQKRSDFSGEIIFKVRCLNGESLLQFDFFVVDKQFDNPFVHRFGIV